ncbi:hypothetical protein Ciccas_009288 [Cichlidogyrus casuarinus]|uniref:Uncharacterized protein n=1 Tax=Cichlidogyrus casuarinus TaxID=1844966 RepID=A0ABD2Q1W8_9PLAT
MDSVYDVVVKCMTKPSAERSQPELDIIYPWFVQKAPLFASLNPDIVYDIMRNCDFVTRQRDFVVIRQFEKGDW